MQDRRQVHPTPADDLQVREVCLPHLVDGRGLVFEFASSLDDDEGRTGDQVVSLEKPVGRAFRDKIPLTDLLLRIILLTRPAFDVTNDLC